MKVAVEGCAHGELEKIYDTIAQLEAQNNVKVDLLLCCGDFQASRNHGDLECMAVPPKYRQLCTFYKYYSGEKVAPMLTIIIGGNHEASNYFQELPYGGWVAPNIYYLGYAGLVKVGGIRIAGLSGIFKARDYHKGRYEMVPYSEDSKRSCYHIRTLDVFRLKQVTKPVDVMLSHDWPQGIYRHGNVDALLRKKPFFKDDIENNRLGSPPCADLLDTLQPRHWFSAHLHVKFPALVTHENGAETKFLALDKCLPRRQFLQLVDIPHQGDIEFCYDEEWCAILQSTDHLTSISASASYMPGPGHTQRWNFTPTEEEKQEVSKRFNGDLRIPDNFVQSAPPHDPSLPRQPPWCSPNPQTTSFCQILGLEDPLSLLLQQTPKRSQTFNNSRHNYSSFQMSADSDALESSWGTPVRNRTPMALPTPRLDSPLNLSEINQSQSSPSSLPCRSPLVLPQPFNESSDKIQPRTPMNLPAPKSGSSNSGFDLLGNASLIADSPLTEVHLNPPECSTPKRDNPEPLSADVIPYSLDAQPTPINSETSSPGPKRFRRRNVAMYSLLNAGADSDT